MTVELAGLDVGVLPPFVPGADEDPIGTAGRCCLPSKRVEPGECSHSYTRWVFPNLSIKETWRRVYPSSAFSR